MAKRGYPQVLNEGDFTTTDHQLLTSTTAWTDIAVYQCPAQQEIAVGSGSPGHPDNQGHFYAFIRTGEGTPVEITGKLRIVITDYNETKMVVVKEFDEVLTHGDLNDITKQLPLPEFAYKVGEDSYIKLQIKPTAVHVTADAGNDNLGWADATESIFKLPVTVYV